MPATTTTTALAHPPLSPPEYVRSNDRVSRVLLAAIVGHYQGEPQVSRLICQRTLARFEKNLFPLPRSEPTPPGKEDQLPGADLRNAERICAGYVHSKAYHYRPESGPSLHDGVFPEGITAANAQRRTEAKHSFCFGRETRGV